MLRRSLAGEYVSLALMIHAGFGALIWAAYSIHSPPGLLIAAIGLWIVCRAGGVFSQRGFAPFVTTGMIIAGCMFWRKEFGDSAPWLFSPPVFIGMLGAVLLLDVLEFAMAKAAAGRQFREWNWHRITVWAIVAAFLVYIVVIPIAGSIIGRLNPSEGGFDLDDMSDMSLADQLQLRTMTAMTAFWFFALGAAIGSFLNVVAYRMPRGESVVFRRSRCPKCKTEIKGRDNVPILGWLLLNGRCRACDIPIAFRYPIVESVTAAIFLLLYFVELISGGANIPVRQPNLYNGVVWIIFYTKWDLVALYLFHCFSLSAILAWALIDLDRKRIPWRAILGVGAVLFAMPAIAGELGRILHMVDPLELLPVSWRIQEEVGVGSISPELPDVLATSLVGGLAGGLLGVIAARSIRFRVRHEAGDEQAEGVDTGEAFSPSGHLVSAGVIVGLSLGWQAAAGVWLMAHALRPIAYGFARRWNLSDPPPTAILLAAYVIHLASWRLLTVGWWPSVQTTSVAWAALSIIAVALWFVNRSLPRLRQPITDGGCDTETESAITAPKSTDWTI